jgi:hypothetical protein
MNQAIFNPWAPPYLNGFNQSSGEFGGQSEVVKLGGAPKIADGIVSRHLASVRRLQNLCNGLSVLRVPYV